jgi:signal transduction histidine kinase
MEKDVIENLFKIDKLVSTRGTANEKGSGLGLILCYEFVQKHGGSINVQSQVGKGSRFTFTLPLKKED